MAKMALERISIDHNMIGFINQDGTVEELNFLNTNSYILNFINIYIKLISYLLGSLQLKIFLKNQSRLY